MTTILHEAVAGRARLVPWTVDQYHRGIESGLLPDDPAVELLDIVADLVNDRVLIHERPDGDSYAHVTTMARGEIAPVHAGGEHVSMPIDRLLP